MAQVGASFHECVDLFDCVLWLGLGDHDAERSLRLFVLRQFWQLLESL